MKTLTILMIIGLAGCAAGPSPQMLAHRAYVDQYRPMAVSGTMKWSDYYTGLYAKMLDARAPATALSNVDGLIGYAQQYEAGTITKEAFEHQRRAATIANAADAEAAAEKERNRRAAIAAAFAAQPPIQSTYQIVRPATIPAPTPYYSAPIQPQSNSVTAMWTGQQKQVQTVTYQIGWNCEYRYLSNTFWRVFTGSCPSTVQVQ